MSDDRNCEICALIHKATQMLNDLKYRNETTSFEASSIDELVRDLLEASRKHRHPGGALPWNILAKLVKVISELRD
jgi:hypothetical protein